MKCIRERAVARVIPDREKKTASVAGPNGASLPVRHDRENRSPVPVRRSTFRLCVARAGDSIARWCRRAFEASLRRHVLRVTRNTQLRELSGLDDRSLKDIGISRVEADRPMTSRSNSIAHLSIHCAIVHWWESRRAIAHLSTYPDRTLKDVGLSRGGIEWVVHHGRSDGEKE
jgi:uncharacterized protein YjiS (DUF1127 family)